MLHVQLDYHRSLVNGGTLQSIYKFLGKKNIVGDAMVIDESTLLQANQARDDGLQLPDQNPNTHFIKGGAQVDRFEVT